VGTLYFRVATSALLCGLAVAIGGPVAEAHPGHKRSSRLIGVALASEPPCLKYGYVFEQSASEAARKVADKDADGTVSPEEGEKELARWGEELRRELTICRGPTLATMKCANLAAQQLTDAHATAWESRPGKPLSLVWEFRLDLDPDDRALQVRDAWQRSEVDLTNAAIEPPQDAKASVVDENGSTRKGPLTFNWNADQPGRARTLTVVWQPPLARWLVLSVVGVASLLVAGRLFLVWKRRGARAASPPRVPT
jgi:hypothetical protein